ncbi:hypothetical protein JTB14_022459 [Gonioctena quinquepunctata]|nr:hypothetical protein JTB14_022459 [Gonioctena quinquepunctata]
MCQERIDAGLSSWNRGYTISSRFLDEDSLQNISQMNSKWFYACKYDHVLRRKKRLYQGYCYKHCENCPTRRHVEGRLNL